jgi:hypothetical protein
MLPWPRSVSDWPVQRLVIFLASGCFSGILVVLSAILFSILTYFSGVMVHEAVDGYF